MWEGMWKCGTVRKMYGSGEDASVVNYAARFQEPAQVVCEVWEEV